MDFLKFDKYRSLNLIQQIGYVICGILFMANVGVVHRDVRPSNIIVFYHTSKNKQMTFVYDKKYIHFKNMSYISTIHDFDLAETTFPLGLRKIKFYEDFGQFLFHLLVIIDRYNTIHIKPNKPRHSKHPKLLFFFYQ